MSALTGGGGSSPPAQPPFHPVKIGGTGGIANKALQQDISRYLSYQFPVFPGMTGVREAEINDAYKQLTGPLSPDFQNQFMNNATLGTTTALGGGDPFSGMNLRSGSLAKGAQSAAFTRSALAKQDYDRSRFDTLLQENPVPQLGLSQSDLASLFIYNTGAQNSFAMSNYANQVAGANAAFQNQMNTYSTIGNTISGLGSIYANYQMNSGGFGGGTPYAGDWSGLGFDFSGI